MKKEEFLLKAKNTKKYKILKQLPEMPDSLIVGESYHSDILYNHGYNMENLVQHRYLMLNQEPYPFQEKLIGKNRKSILCKCPECGSIGTNEPLNITCGNCGYFKCVTYYDAETINDYIASLK